MDCLQYLRSCTLDKRVCFHTTALHVEEYIKHTIRFYSLQIIQHLNFKTILSPGTVPGLFKIIFWLMVKIHVPRVCAVVQKSDIKKRVTTVVGLCVISNSSDQLLAQICVVKRKRAKNLGRIKSFHALFFFSQYPIRNCIMVTLC